MRKFGPKRFYQIDSSTPCAPRTRSAGSTASARAWRRASARARTTGSASASPRTKSKVNWVRIQKPVVTCGRGKFSVTKCAGTQNNFLNRFVLQFKYYLELPLNSMNLL
jgi:hypothetical protein